MSATANPTFQVIEVKPRRRWWLIATAVLLLAILAGWGGKLAYRAGKGWRARQLSRQAEECIKKEKWEEASAKAHAAYQLMFEEPEVIRAAAHLQRAGGHTTEALTFWKQLDRLKGMTLSDRREQVEDLFAAGAVTEAETENQRLRALDPPDAGDLRLAARIALSNGNRPQAVDFARKAQEADPANPDGNLLLALLRIDSSDGASRDAGLRALLDLAHGGGKTGLAALLFLAGRRDLPPETIAEIIPLLRENPRANEAQRLLALDLEIAAQPAQREAIIERTISSVPAGEAGRKRALGVWLNGHGEWERTLKIIPQAEAMQRKDLLLVHLDALAALNRWVDIRRILETRAVPLDEVYREIFLARSAMQMGDATLASLHWTQAHTAAAASVEQMWFLGRYADTIGQASEAQRAYDSLKSNAVTARAAYQALLHLTEKTHETEAQRLLLREMRDRWPKDTAVANDYAYLSLLERRDVDQCLKIARQLVDQEPSSLPHRTALALGLLRTNNLPAALNVYSGLQVSWPQVAPGAQAVHVAVLGLNGYASEARAEVNGAWIDGLRVEERELIQPWLTGAVPLSDSNLR